MSYKSQTFDPYDKIGSTGGVPGGGPQPKRGWQNLPVKWIAVGAAIVLLGVWWKSDSNAVQAANADGDSASVHLKLDAPKKGASPSGGLGTGRGNKTPIDPSSGTVGSGEAAKFAAAKPPIKSSAKTNPALSRSIEGTIAKWMGKAKKSTKGKVTSSNTVVAVHVRDLDGRVLVNRNTSQALVPASNLKLLTCATAVILAAEGANYETRFEAQGSIEKGVLRGDLIVRAGADPMYVHGGEGGLESWLNPLAKELKRAGIESVQGRLILDEGNYRMPGPGPMWPNPRDYWTDDCALSGGFSANAGCISATIIPGKSGTNAEVRIRPRSHGLKRKSTERVKTTSKGDIKVAVEARGTRLVVRGTIPAKVKRYQPRFAHPDPVDLFGHAIVGGLASRGISIANGFERVRGVAAGQSITSLRTPISTSLAPILRDSNNSVADQLYLWLGNEFGGEGTSAGGARAVAKALEKMGLDSKDWHQVDGSGLSKANRVRADQLTAVLSGVFRKQDKAAMEFRRSLPVAGQSGTLKSRMKTGPAHKNVSAKTGWVEGASTLSGLVQTQSGQQLVFSILINYPKIGSLNTNIFKPMQNEICSVLAAFDGAN